MHRGIRVYGMLGSKLPSWIHLYQSLQLQGSSLRTLLWSNAQLSLPVKPPLCRALNAGPVVEIGSATNGTINTKESPPPATGLSDSPG